MRIIDQPMADYVILGSESGRLYMCGANAWMALYASEYTSEGIQVTWVEPGRREVVLVTMPRYSLEPVSQPLSKIEPYPMNPHRRCISLEAYVCADVIRLYGFDGETMTFFVSQGSA